MLKKLKRNDSTPICGKKTLRFLARMTRSKSSPYKRMDSDDKEKKSKKLDERKVEDLGKGKENIKTVTPKEVKEKKSKKKGWKRVGQVCLTTCRYIGMGAAHMSPATVYASPDYHLDPKVWNKSFSHSYKPKVPPPPAPHWTTTMMFSAW